MRQYELIEKVKSYDKNADEDALARAYVLASKVHYDQRRESGEPYFYHPTSVAQILTEYKMDGDTIIAALLHDTVEDTPTAYEDIEILFGKDIANLVEGVTKLSKIQLIGEDSTQAQNFQELVLATSKDIRILMIKMADRLHNMRTLECCKSPAKRKRVAQETMEIYAPLAERIGMHKIQIEMENLAFQILYPDAFQNIQKQLDGLKAKGQLKLNKLIRQIKTLLSKNHIKANVIGRKKTPYSIWKKLKTHDNSLEEIFDLVGLRILVKTVAECYKTLGVIHTNFKMIPGGRFKDYISTPKDSGYQSIHTSVICQDNQRLEIQIRTFDMEEEAEFGVAAHWEYKEGKHKDAKKYVWMRELLELIKSSKTPAEFLERTKMSLYQDKIFCFSDKGKVYSLPKESTVRDFAYLFGTEWGNACVGAIVNGQKKKPNDILADGESIHLLKGKNVPVDKKWLDEVKTANAKALLSSYLAQKEQKETEKKVREELNEYAEKYHLTFSEENLQQAARQLDYRNVPQLLSDLKKEKISYQKVLKTVHPEIKSSFYHRTLSLIHSWTKRNQTAPILGLKPTDKFTFGTCCHPVVGEAIVAIRKKKNTYVIHRRDCSDLGRYKKSPEKWVAVEWNLSDKNNNPQPARLRILWKTGSATMKQILGVFDQEDVDIIHMNTLAQNDSSTEIMADIQVRHQEHLNRLINVLKKHPKIISVEKESGS